MDAFAPHPMLDSGGSLAGVTTRFQGVELRSTSGSHFRALCVELHLATCSTVCQNAPPSLIFGASGVVSVLFTQIPLPSSSLNSARLIRAHVSFGLVCERFVSL